MPRRINVKPRFFVLLAFIVAVVITVVLLLTRSAPTTTIIYDGITVGSEHNCVVVRNEGITISDNVAQVQYLAVDGQKVTTETSVLRVYQLGYSQLHVDSLYEIQGLLLKDQLSLMQGRQDAYFTKLQEQIDTARYELGNAVLQGNSNDVLWREVKYRELLQERRDYLDSLFGNDPAIAQRLQQERDTLALVTEFIDDDVRPSYDGTLSFYFDGNEQLSPTMVRGMSYTDLQAALKVPGGLTAIQQSGSTPLFRVVRDGVWSFVAIANSSHEFVVNQMYDIHIEGYADLVVLGKFTGEAGEGKEKLLFFDVDQHIDRLLNARQVTASIGRFVEGMKVPASAVKRRRGNDVVYAKNAEGKFVPVPVAVIERDNKWCIIEQIDLSSSGVILEINSTVIRAK